MLSLSVFFSYYRSLERFQGGCKDEKNTCVAPAVLVRGWCGAGAGRGMLPDGGAVARGGLELGADA